ncbi:extracellular solute-binding protein [Streptomyces sp. RB6PN25]|uniref:Extracellular solute-binding protein n=1 Tax=Streptomyces humicola TaxID=2953240 RepID=A0ABT1PQR8_9ACTN|nr:extracellular solute-binding protein [Streptomyces humicola]MCQ4080007.1 extracellular solute-binding protein [Streptomyces humicola]
MRITRSAVALTVPLALSAAMLAGCGAGAAGGSGSSAGGKAEGAITFQTWNLRAKYQSFFNGLITQFEKEYPSVTVKWIDQPADNYAEKLSADAAGGTLPDVVNVSPDLAYPLAKAGLLMNLDTSQATSTYKSEYTPEAWQGNELPGLGGSFSFPWYLNTGPLFYNKALFQQAGLDPNTPPQTYDQLFADAERMAQHSGGKIAALAQEPTIEDFGRYGVPLMNSSGTAFTYNDAKGVELLTKYKRLYDEGGLGSQALSTTPDAAGQAFLEQKVAMNPGSALDLDNFKTNAPSLYKNIGITDAPNNTGHPNMYVMGLGVNNQSKHKAAAIAFAHFITDKQNQEAFAHQVAIFPSTAGSLQEPYWTKDDGTDEGRVRVASAEMLKGAVNYTPPVMSDQMKTVLQQEVAKALQGKESPQQALNNAVNESNQLLKQG